jgi:hypothetical protein
MTELDVEEKEVMTQQEMEEELKTENIALKVRLWVDLTLFLLHTN